MFLRASKNLSPFILKITSPTRAHQFAHAEGIEDRCTGSPVSVLDLAVFHAKGVVGRRGAIDELAGGLGLGALRSNYIR